MTDLTRVLDELAARASAAELSPRLGKVIGVVGLAVEVSGIVASVGEVTHIRTDDAIVPAEVVGFRGNRLVLMPLGEVSGVRPGTEVRATGRRPSVPVGRALLGRIVDALGRPIDGQGAVAPEAVRAVHQPPPPALARRRIAEPLETGVRAIDALLPLGRGQRMGIFAGSGVGKSVLLGMLAGHGEADVNVIALVGERGREVREFVERDLGPEALGRSVVVVATSDEPALLRRQAAWTATAIAEFFRDRGARVLLMMDSVTRFAMAQREIGLAAGEPPATRGYPPSVFALLPRLLERAGTTEHAGSITGVYTVLVEGDDFNEPIGDTVRSILDGHIVLSRDLAAANHFPAIDVLGSVSRLAVELMPPAQAAGAAALRDCLAAWRDVRDLVAVGAYVRGSDARTDRALDALDRVNAFLRQDRAERSTLDETRRCLATLLPGAVKR
jgi:flagellum-specific ATP synthase